MNHDPNLKDIKEITLTYHFYPSADQSVANVLQEEIEKHQEEERKLLARRRALEERGVKLPEVSGHQGGAHGVIAPGFNPKDTAETYVKKVMTNRKRIERTIAKYEQE